MNNCDRCGKMADLLHLKNVWDDAYVCEDCLCMADIPFVSRQQREYTSEVAMYMVAMDAVTEMLYRQMREDMIDLGQSLINRVTTRFNILP